MSNIKFELNNPETFTLTTAQLSTIHALTVFAEAEHGDTVECSIVEADNPNAPHVKVFISPPNVTATRYWIDPDGTIGMAEDVTWDE